PFDCKAARPPSHHDRHHRGTDRTLTRNSSAITPLPCPPANLSAASASFLIPRPRTAEVTAEPADAAPPVPA
ncbi:hypothetical protein MUU72_04925, partial [Streptomyces sp. RS10V-4]|uniref:hypothetical protein n=1 Tax=Streptomyces rhizoryzae TaxID=2932493 RepID=UPI0020054535